MQERQHPGVRVPLLLLAGWTRCLRGARRRAPAQVEFVRAAGCDWYSNTSVVPSLMIARLKVQSNVLAVQQKGKKIEEKSNAPQKIRSPIISRGAVEMGTSRGPGFVVGLCYLLRTSSLASPDVVHPSPAFRLPRRARVSLHLRPRRGSESRHTRVVPRPPH